jgi:hypothetical protein
METLGAILVALVIVALIFLGIALALVLIAYIGSIV